MSDKKTKGVNFSNIPQELKTESKFCLWRYEKRQGNLTKVPYNPNNGQHAKRTIHTLLVNIKKLCWNMPWADGTESAFVLPMVSALSILTTASEKTAR